uniref:Uncharacterized protein n=1 Tax=Glossina austeni TaxID=7395 RepID=A0A1A9UML2_GLOAU
MPKGGTLSVIVDASMDRSIQDALLVPVSVNYERLVDGSFVRKKQIPESFGKAITADNDQTVTDGNKHVNMFEENLTFTEPGICCKKLIEAAMENCEIVIEPEIVMERRRIARNLATYLGEDNEYDDTMTMTMTFSM